MIWLVLIEIVKIISNNLFKVENFSLEILLSDVKITAGSFFDVNYKFVASVTVSTNSLMDQTS